jgi:hypothetical protein
MTLYKWLNGYHLCRERDLPHWIERDLYVAETDEPESEWLVESNKVVVRRCRIVEHLQGWNERTARLFAADCAERVLHCWEEVYPDDDRPRLAIQAARDYANGLIGEEALRRAAVAAFDASSAAGHAADAVYAAAGRSAWADSATAAAYAARAAYAAADYAAYAARAAYAAAAYAGDAGGAYAGYTARAARAARAAEREWQAKRILDYSHGGL